MSHYLHLGLGWFDDHAGGLERYQHGIATAQAAVGRGDISAWVQSKKTIDPSTTCYPVTAYASPDEPRLIRRRKLRELAEARFNRRDFTFVSHHASVSSAISYLTHNVPHVVHFQGPWNLEAAAEGAPRWKTWLQSREEQKVYCAADRLITLSHAFKEILVERFKVPPDRIEAIPGGIDFQAAACNLRREEARRQLGWPNDKKIILCVRRLVRRVGIDILIEAVRLLAVQSPKLLKDFCFSLVVEVRLAMNLNSAYRTTGCVRASNFWVLSQTICCHLPIAQQTSVLCPPSRLKGLD